MHPKNQDYAPIYSMIERIKELGILDEKHIKIIEQKADDIIDTIENPNRVKEKTEDFPWNKIPINWDDLSYIARLDNEHKGKMKAFLNQANQTDDHAELDKLKEEVIVTHKNYNHNRQTLSRNFWNKILINLFKYAVYKPSKFIKVSIALMKQLRLGSQIAGDKRILKGYDHIQDTLSNALELKEAIGLENNSLSAPQEDKTQKISLLFDYLSKQNCIDISYHNDFVSLFTNNVSKRAIKWKDGERLLIHLIETMITNQYYNLVTEEDLLQFIERGFINKKMEPFKRKQLQSAKISQEIKNNNLIDVFFSKKEEKKVNITIKNPK